MRLTHLLGMGGVRMKTGFGLSVATVALQGCAGIVHVEGTVTGSTVAVVVEVSAEMVITVAMGCIGLWLVARSRVNHMGTPEEINDVDTQCELQQGTLLCNGDTWMLATCRLVEILCWDRGDGRRAVLHECYGGVTLWQAARRLGVLDDPDMCDKDVVIMKLMTMTSISTALQ